MQARKWSDDEGKTRYATEVIVRNTTFVGKTENNNNVHTSSEESFGELPIPDAPNIPDEDLPF